MMCSKKDSMIFRKILKNLRKGFCSSYNTLFNSLHSFLGLFIYSSLLKLKTYKADNFVLTLRGIDSHPGTLKCLSSLLSTNCSLYRGRFNCLTPLLQSLDKCNNGSRFRKPIRKASDPNLCDSKKLPG